MRNAAMWFAFVFLIAGKEPSPIDQGSWRLHYIQNPIGAERYTIVRDGDGLALSSEFEFTDRGGHVQLAANLRTAADLTPLMFSAKGRSYRFVNVDSSVRVDPAARAATIHDAVYGDTKVDLPERFFTTDGYAPFAVQMLLI